MKQFQLSVFYNGYFLSYHITTANDVVFNFSLKSAPVAAMYAPDDFTVTQQDEDWTFDQDLEAAFKNGVIHALKKVQE